MSMCVLTQSRYTWTPVPMFNWVVETVRAVRDSLGEPAISASIVAHDNIEVLVTIYGRSGVSRCVFLPVGAPGRRVSPFLMELPDLVDGLHFAGMLLDAMGLFVRTARTFLEQNDASLAGVGAGADRLTACADHLRQRSPLFPDSALPMPTARGVTTPLEIFNWAAARVRQVRNTPGYIKGLPSVYCGRTLGAPVVALYIYLSEYTWIEVLIHIRGNENVLNSNPVVSDMSVALQMLCLVLDGLGLPMFRLGCYTHEGNPALHRTPGPHNHVALRAVADHVRVDSTDSRDTQLMRTGSKT